MQVQSYEEIHHLSFWWYSNMDYRRKFRLNLMSFKDLNHEHFTDKLVVSIPTILNGQIFHNTV